MADSLLELLRAWTRAGGGERVALLDTTGHVSYRRLLRAVEEAVGRFRGEGVTEQGRIALVARNDIPSVVAFAAINAIGAPVLVLHDRMARAERDTAVRGFGAGHVVEDGHVVAVARTGDPPGLPPGPAIAMVTSGTLGRPRIVCRAWAGSMANSRAYAQALGLEPIDCVLTTSPLNHSYSLEAGILAALSAGAGHAIPSVPATPAGVAALVHRGAVTVLQTVPALYRWYAGSGIPQMRVWKRCVSAGDLLPPEIAEEWARRGAPLWNHYGASEIGQITLGPADPAGSVGRPLEGIDVCAPQTAGAPGAVRVRCAGLSPLLVTEEGAEPIADSDGWVDIGDLGRVDGFGRLYLAGRQGGLLNIAGNKVDPAEVEAEIRRLPGVRDCAVVGREVDGAVRLWAFVEPSPGSEPSSLDPRALRARLRGRLSPTKVPTVVRVVEELPRTGTGKIRRWLLGASPQAAAATGGRAPGPGPRPSDPRPQEEP
ncbi:class I adenylate-forming enzyme family protein [Marinactinospora thermotolerans]|uniref:Fatty acid CoA ligase FadD22 n=2 Tax=Marinactinospora thermotolerans TaxID=531310 RepID=A0A1T4T453_9ACTN|nr:class I adenylate-forming enzyme family protein [Marinactinospora thermotolerans]AET51857.1 CoA-ligase [Marinactinospora thermotolerans]SKA35206.1 fatty acid CoA ligase FadD22 [Marinactinospora thermotolerans DSM 45154]